MKYWEILLIKQREREKSGLTLPFLIGSQKYLPITHVHQSIKELIRDMVLGNTFETHIRYCMDTATLIFKIRANELYCYYPTYNNNKQVGLSFANSDMLKNDFGNNIETLIEGLIEKFQDVIDKELFSAEPDLNKREANWQSFTGEDVEFIENSFKAL